MQNFHTRIIFICMAIISLLSCNSANSPENALASVSNSMKRNMSAFTFDPSPHILGYEQAAKLAKTFKDSVRFYHNRSMFRVNLVEGKFIEVDSTFKSLITNQTDSLPLGLRVHFGFNKRNNSIEYYLSNVTFDTTIQSGSGNLDTLVFYPEDTALTGTNLDYLKGANVYKVNEKRKVEKINFNTPEWDEMVTTWVDYQKCILVGKTQIQSINRPERFSITRSAIIPVQILQDLIQDNAIEYINIVSGGIITDEGFMRQTVFFTHNNLSEQEKKSLIGNLEFKKSLSIKQNNWELMNEKIKPSMREISSIKELSDQDLIYLNLESGKTNRNLVGVSADYSQLCPTRCGKLLGNFDQASRVFRLQGMTL